MKLYFATTLAMSITCLAACSEPPAENVKSAVSEATMPAQTFTYTLTPRVVVKDEALSDDTLAERMASLDIPNAAALVTVDGKPVYEDYIGEDTGPDTLFQSASMSKAVAALGIALLAEERGIGLDEDIRPFVKTIDLAAIEGGENIVTLRALLSHTAGGNVHGFPGYAEGDIIPTTAQVILGDGNTDAVTFVGDIGSYRYSGGGYTVAQLFAEDVSGEPFPSLMERLVLGPLGMGQSTFDFPLDAADWPNPIAAGHNSDAPVPGGWHHYPESAAAGLWTTARDYARFAETLMQSLKGNGPISQNVANAMVQPVDSDYGLGLAVVTKGDHLSQFRHSGANNGYRSEFTALPGQNAVAVILTNHDRGNWVNGEFIRGVSVALGEPALDQVTLVRAALTPDITARCAGAYADPDTGGLDFELAIEDGRAQLVENGGRLDVIHTGDGTFVFAPQNLAFNCATEDGVTVIRVRDERYVRMPD